MAMTRWEPLTELQRFRNDMGQLFNSFGQEWPELAVSYPPLNVWEDENNLYLEAELPGMELSDLEITVRGGDQLTIKGERKQPAVDKGIWRRQERGFGTFTRVLTLPVMVDADKVQARLVNGVLTITLPKSPAAKPKKIAVKGD